MAESVLATIFTELHFVPAVELTAAGDALVRPPDLVARLSLSRS